jgi:hypothetical protein
MYVCTLGSDIFGTETFAFLCSMDGGGSFGTGISHWHSQHAWMALTHYHILINEELHTKVAFYSIIQYQLGLGLFISNATYSYVAVLPEKGSELSIGPTCIRTYM